MHWPIMAGYTSWFVYNPEGDVLHVEIPEVRSKVV